MEPGVPAGAPQGRVAPAADAAAADARPLHLGMPVPPGGAGVADPAPDRCRCSGWTSRCGVALFTLAAAVLIIAHVRRRARRPARVRPVVRRCGSAGAHYVRLAVGSYAYYLLLAGRGRAARRLARAAAADRGWEKTAHVGAHRGRPTGRGASGGVTASTASGRPSVVDVRPDGRPRTAAGQAARAARTGPHALSRSRCRPRASSVAAVVHAPGHVGSPASRRRGHLRRAGLGRAERARSRALHVLVRPPAGRVDPAGRLHRLTRAFDWRRQRCRRRPRSRCWWPRSSAAGCSTAGAAARAAPRGRGRGGRALALNPLSIEFQRASSSTTSRRRGCSAPSCSRSRRDAASPPSLGGVCFGIAVLSKETTLVLFPAFFLVLWQHGDPRQPEVHDGWSPLSSPG